MKEIWKTIEWFNWRYEVSNKWRVKTLDYNGTWKHCIMKQQPHWRDKNYRFIHLRRPWYRKGMLVHRLVWLAFIPNPENKPQINHKNWITSDNRAENLEWCTNTENHLHSYRELWRKWKKWDKYWSNWRARKIKQYSLHWEYIETYDSIKRAEDKYWVKHSNICLVCQWNRNKAIWFKREYAK